MHTSTALFLPFWRGCENEGSSEMDSVISSCNGVDFMLLRTIPSTFISLSGSSCMNGLFVDNKNEKSFHSLKIWITEWGSWVNENLIINLRTHLRLLSNTHQLPSGLLRNRKTGAGKFIDLREFILNQGLRLRLLSISLALVSVCLLLCMHGWVSISHEVNGRTRHSHSSLS